MEGNKNNNNNNNISIATAATKSPLKKIIAVASIAAGVQFGWALQLSLLTPYVQLLGIPHKWAAFIWLCGPISGMIVQPIVGYQSDRCRSRFGRRRPFIAAGTVFVVLAVLLISFAADLGHLFGDHIGAGPHSEPPHPKIRAIVIFVVGFWVLDVANNMLQGPCRAFLADLADGHARTTRTANSFYSFFMAVGNVLGYLAGSITHLYKIIPFTRSPACDVYCANLKTCFFIAVILLITVTTIALTTVHDKPLSSEPSLETEGEGSGGSSAVFGQITEAFRELKRPMWVLLFVTCLNWVAWFPFLLFDTDWMGREVYGGKVGDGSNNLYALGVRAGSLGLMLNSIVLGFMSLGVEFLGRRMGGAKRLWGVVNFVLAICLGLTVLITKLAEQERSHRGGAHALPSIGIRVSALTLFSVLGIPLAITYSIPFAMASIFSALLVQDKMVVSILSGPWDALFGGGNLPAFVVGAIAAAMSGILALTMLPSPPPDVPIVKKMTSTIGSSA
ncbi:hypothetical protein Sjap_021423 [Stephania japonica]|uniref:Sucrose transporter n=1 Tax=Stephania japonica TaxID=461633 RepID=A0AAP0HTG6_9MAGN